MNETLRHNITSADLRLHEAYLAWMQAAVGSEQALHAWFDGPPRDHADLYASYRAALDREEAAASELERVSGTATGHRAVPCRYGIHHHTYTTPMVREIPQQRLS
jgi:hypothetical protein